MSIATDYQKFIRESRRDRNRLDKDAVRRLDGMLRKTADDMRQAIRETPRGILGDRYQRQLLANIDGALDGFQAEYKDLLDQTIISAAAIAAQRERELLNVKIAQRETYPAHHHIGVFNAAARADVRFQSVPQRVLERLYARTYKDGLKLSDSLHNLTAETKQQARDLVAASIARGEGFGKLARAIQPLITPAEGGPDAKTLRYRATRIARTELPQAFREGHIESLKDGDGKLLSYVEAIGWRLSASHPHADICDAWAGDDSGLGPGNYMPDDIPGGHCHCYCYTVTILKAFPDEQFQTIEPKPDDVPGSQRKYYGAELDKPAEEQP